MYLNSNAGGAFHIWRQRFPKGHPVQMTSGLGEEEGMAMAPDGRSIVTSVGSKQSSVWVHDSGGKRQLSLEGYSYDPKFTPDGKKLCYRILNGALSSSDSSELRVVELDSGRDELLLPGFAIFGRPGNAYDISPDGGQVVVAAIDREGKERLWLTPLDRRSPPHQIPNVQGAQPLFGSDNQIYFRAVEGRSAFAYRVRDDGTELRKVVDQPIARLVGISKDKQWLVVRLHGTKGTKVTAFPLQSGSPLQIGADGGEIGREINLNWSADGRRIFLTLPASAGEESAGKTYVLPLTHSHMFPDTPVDGFQLAAEIARLPGALLMDEPEAVPGPSPEVYGFVRKSVQRNLFRLPLR
jgi:Tol biopolymer transport system component